MEVLELHPLVSLLPSFNLDKFPVTATICSIGICPIMFGALEVPQGGMRVYLIQRGSIFQKLISTV